MDPRQRRAEAMSVWAVEAVAAYDSVQPGRDVVVVLGVSGVDVEVIARARLERLGHRQSARAQVPQEGELGPDHVGAPPAWLVDPQGEGASRGSQA